MSSVNSVRITGLATGMDTEQMIKDMLVGEQNRVDGAKQKEQITKWQQESYRDTIKNVKGLYDKYFSATSKDFILSSKVYSTMVVDSKNSNVISATAGAGADNINYQFKVGQVAKPANLESSIIKDADGHEIKLDKNKTLGELNIVKAIEVDTEGKPIEVKTTIKINNKEIEISSNDKVIDIASKINDVFSDGSVKATYSEMTGKLSIQTNTTGVSSELTFEGELFINLGMSTESIGTKNGSNNQVTVYDSYGTEIKTIENESNIFTIDNITYNIKGVTKGDELVSMTSTKDTTKTVEKVKAFIDDYNKIIEDIYDSVTQKKNRDYQPLTEAQKEDMSEEEIEKWEKKAKEGLLRNDKDLRAFMDDIKKAIFAPIGESGLTLNDIGIKADEDYNKQGQLQLDVDKFTKLLEDNGDLVYKATTEAFEKIKDVTYKYAGSSSSIFVKKAGMENSSTAINNLFSEQIRRQEEQIKNLTIKMQDKEQSLYKKFATLETNMNKLNSQMSYLTNSMGI